MVGWHHQINGHEFEQAPGDGEEQGSLGCCSPWGSKSRTWLSEQQQFLLRSKGSRHEVFSSCETIIVAHCVEWFSVPS